MSILSVDLDDELQAYVETQVRSGRYASVQELVVAGLRRLMEHEAQVTALQEALIEGEESGPGEPFDVEAFLAERSKRESRSSLR